VLPLVAGMTEVNYYAQVLSVEMGHLFVGVSLEMQSSQSCPPEYLLLLVGTSVLGPKVNFPALKIFSKNELIKLLLINGMVSKDNHTHD
jgi:hypothetical protein